jgi:hypothetical protein
MDPGTLARLADGQFNVLPTKYFLYVDLFLTIQVAKTQSCFAGLSAEDRVFIYSIFIYFYFIITL